MLTSEKFVDADSSEDEESEADTEEKTSEQTEDTAEADEDSAESSDSPEAENKKDYATESVAETIEKTSPPAPNETRRKEMLNSFEKLASEAEKEHGETEDKQAESNVAPDPEENTPEDERKKEGGAE